MKEFKYTIDGKEYNVEIGDINEETYVASVKVNGEAYEVGMEKPAEPEKKKVELGKPVAESNEESAAPATNANVANATKAPLPGTITAINVSVGDASEGWRRRARARSHEDGQQHRGREER